jgi:hypothetical protein
MWARGVKAVPGADDIRIPVSECEARKHARDAPAGPAPMMRKSVVRGLGAMVVGYDLYREGLKGRKGFYTSTDGTLVLSDRTVPHAVKRPPKATGRLTHVYFLSSEVQYPTSCCPSGRFDICPMHLKEEVIALNLSCLF